MPRVDIKNFEGKKIALVLSGGVVKAASWHLGVGLALDDLGFSFKSNTSPPDSSLEISTYVGSSAGSLINLYFASGYKPIDVIESYLSKNTSKLKPITYRDMLYLKKAMKNPPRMDLFHPFDGFPIFLKQLLKPVAHLSGIFSTLGLQKYISNNVITSNSFDDYAADMFVVSTQLDHSRKVIFSKYKYPNPTHDTTSVYYTGIPIADAVASSMSVPPFYSPYPIKNPYTGHVDYYIDGEIRETLSTHVAIDNKAEFIISSWTHTPYHYHDEVGSLINYGIPAIALQSIFLMIQKKIVTARAQRATAKDVINSVYEYMNQNDFSQIHRNKILSILERKLNYKSNVHLIDISPRHDDYKLFFASSFSLNPKNSSQMVKAGYKRAIEIFKNHEWES